MLKWVFSEHFSLKNIVGQEKDNGVRSCLLHYKCFFPCPQRPLWIDLPAQRLCILHAGHLHLQPAAVPGLLHHHEGKCRCGELAGPLPGRGYGPSFTAPVSPQQLRSSEKVLPVPLFCIVATAVVWAAALYFFFQNLSSWEVSSSLSIFPFYFPTTLFIVLAVFNLFLHFLNWKLPPEGIGFVLFYFLWCWRLNSEPHEC